MRKGRFIVIYAANNLGKSTQLDLLEEYWQKLERKYTRLKYPIYDLEPTGPLINKALRGGKKIKEKDLQRLFAQNRRDYQEKLIELLDKGDVIAEDYVGTGLAWGLTREVDKKDLVEFNKGLLVPDVSVLLNGERFVKGKEERHRNEDISKSEWERSRWVHLDLAAEFGWRVINANQDKREVNQDIIDYLIRQGIIKN